MTKAVKVEKTFSIIELMEDLRDIWRQTAPLHDLTDQQKEEVILIIGKAMDELSQLEESI